MKIFTLLFLFLVSAINSFSQEKYNILFRLENGKADSVLIGYSSESDKQMDEVVDTVVLKDGVLKYNLKYKGFVNALIIPLSQMHKFSSGPVISKGRISFYMKEGDKITVDAKIMDDILRYKIEGNKISKEVAELYNEHPGNKGLMAIEAKYSSTKQAERSKEVMDAYMAERRANNLVNQQRTIAFIKKHPDYEYSPRLLLGLSQKDTVLSLYNKLTPSARESFFGKILTKMINGWFISTPGQQMPDFEASTIDGKSFRLSNYKNKFVLMDFWGSWCSPCLAESPEMIALTEKYKDKLAVIGLIANDTKENARSAITRHKLNWVQLFSETNEFGAKFGVLAYPTKILLDKNGVVLQVFSGTSSQVFKDIVVLLDKGK